MMKTSMRMHKADELADPRILCTHGHIASPCEAKPMHELPQITTPNPTIAWPYKNEILHASYITLRIGLNHMTLPPPRFCTHYMASQPYKLLPYVVGEQATHSLTMTLKQPTLRGLSEGRVLNRCGSIAGGSIWRD